MSLPVNKVVKSELEEANSVALAESPPGLSTVKNDCKDLEQINKEVEELTLLSRNNNNNANTDEVFVRNKGNNSLQYLLQCYESSDSESTDDDDNGKQFEVDKRECSTEVEESDSDSEADSHRKLSPSDKVTDDSDSDSSSDAVLFLETSTDDDVEVVATPNNKALPSEGKGARKKESMIKAPGEMDLNDLPPVQPLPEDIEELCEKETFLHIGYTSAILNVLVTIEALPQIPSFDMETIFYIDKTSDGEDGKKQALGAVFDVIGAVTQPMYIVRFNSRADIDVMGVKIGAPVYCPPKSPYTKYVFMKELLKHKGSDASWIGDTEVPPEQLEFSDDEEERRVKRSSRRTKRQHSTDAAASAMPPSPSGSLERHQTFETRMNRVNELDSELYHLTDVKRSRDSARREQSRIDFAYHGHGRGTRRTYEWEQPVQLPPFNPLVPPPSYFQLAAASGSPALMAAAATPALITAANAPPPTATIMAPPHFPASWNRLNALSFSSTNSSDSEFLNYARSLRSSPNTPKFKYPSHKP